MALPSPQLMLSPIATLSARHPAQRAIAVAISSFGTKRRSAAVYGPHRSLGSSGHWLVRATDANDYSDCFATTALRPRGRMRLRSAWTDEDSTVPEAPAESQSTLARNYHGIA